MIKKILRVHFEFCLELPIHMSRFISLEYSLRIHKNEKSEEIFFVYSDSEVQLD